MVCWSQIVPAMRANSHISFQYHVLEISHRIQQMLQIRALFPSPIFLVVRHLYLPALLIGEAVSSMHTIKRHMSLSNSWCSFIPWLGQYLLGFTIEELPFSTLFFPM